MLADPNIHGFLGGNGGYTEGARVYNSSNIVVAHATNVDVPFDTEIYDTDGIHSLVSNTDRFTCQTAGIYFIAGQFFWDNHGSGFRLHKIWLNGSIEIARTRQNKPSVADNEEIQIHTVWKLDVGDYVALRIQQSSGGNLNVVADGHNSPAFMMQRIG